MELLTNRLILLVDQVSDNVMADIVNEERLQHERIAQYTQRDKMLSFKQIAHDDYTRRNVNRTTLAWKKKQEEQKKNEELKKQDVNAESTKIKTVCDIWGLSKKAKAKGNRDDDSKETTKDSSASAIKLTKFRQAAKTAVLLKAITKDRDICTCESLDTRCKVHDG